MKILMIAPQPFFQPRGTPLSVLHRINTLAKLGNSIDLITYHIGEDIPIENVTYYRVMKIPFIKKIKIGPSSIKILLDIFIILKAFKLLLKNKYVVDAQLVKYIVEEERSIKWQKRIYQPSSSYLG